MVCIRLRTGLDVKANVDNCKFELLGRTVPFQEFVDLPALC